MRNRLIFMFMVLALAFTLLFSINELLTLGTTVLAAPVSQYNTHVQTNSIPSAAAPMPAPALAAPTFDCATPVRMMPLGDDITIGTGSSNGAGYRQPLYLAMRSAGYNIDFVGTHSSTTTIPNYDTEYDGEPNWTDSHITTTIIISRLQDLNTPVDVILLHLGPNAADTDAGDIEIFLDNLDIYFPDTYVALALIINEAPNSAQITTFNDNVLAMASARTGDLIIIVDQEQALNYIDDMADTRHPNDAGYYKMTDAWLAELQNPANIALPLCPSLQIVKTTETTPVISGGDVTFSIEITNSFPVAARDVSVTDPLSDCNPSSQVDIPTGGHTSFSCTVNNVTQNFINYAIVNGRVGTPVSNTHMIFVAVTDATPGIAISKSPAFQTVANGENAAFTINITNTGDVELDLVVEDPLGDNNCVTNAPASLTAAQSVQYNCTRSNVTGSFTNIITVTGTAAVGPPDSVMATAAAVVTVFDAAIAISKSPASQTIDSGNTANFTINITNTGGVPLDLSVADPLGDSNCVTNAPPSLNATQSTTYSCTTSNVTGDFTNMITVTGTYTPPFGNPVMRQAQASAFVDVRPIIAVVKEAHPDQLNEPGGMVVFTATVANQSEEMVTLTSLVDERYGNVTSLANGNIITTNCNQGETIPANSMYQCTFTAMATGQPGNQIDDLMATAQDDDGNITDDKDSTIVKIVNVPSAIEVTVTSAVTAVTEPGQMVSFTVHINNTSPADLVNIDILVDDALGNLNGKGDCVVPPAGINIALGGVYQCTFPAMISGNAGESKTHIILASGADDDSDSVSDSDQMTIHILAPEPILIFLPFVANHLIPDEPNNTCAEAYPIMLNRDYRFLPDDMTDVYRFELPSSGRIVVDLTNFVPIDGQIVLWRGVCGSLLFVGSNGDFSATKQIIRDGQPAGPYIIQVINDGTFNDTHTYRLRVSFTAN